MLEAFEKVGSRELVAPVKRPGKECCDAGSRGVQPCRVDFGTGPDSRVFTGDALLFVGRFVRAKVELKRPSPAHVRICADTSNVEQTKLVNPRGKNDRELVAFRAQTRKPGGRLERRKRVEVAVVPRHQGAGFVLAAPSRVIWLEPDQTVDAQFEPNFRNPELFF